MSEWVAQGMEMLPQRHEEDLQRQLTDLYMLTSAGTNFPQFASKAQLSNLLPGEEPVFWEMMRI